MRIAMIVSSILLIVWVVLTMLVMWTGVLDSDMYIKLSITMAVVLGATILIALALREYGTEKKLKDHNYID